MSQAHRDLVDPDDFCRACRGKGGQYEPTDRGTTMFVDCWMCHGTGQRTVSVDVREVAQ